jgi:UDP-N-acetylmuramate--alanine ligase
VDKVEDSKLFITKDLPLTGVTVAVDEDAAVLLMLELNGSYLFDIKNTKRVLLDLRFGLPGNII